MKRCLEILGHGLPVLVVMFTWVIGAIDLFWYFFTSHPITIIRWDDAHVAAAIVYPVIAWSVVEVWRRGI